MTVILLLIVLAFLIAAVVLLIVLVRRTSKPDSILLASRLDAFEKTQERIERGVREEVACSREELGKTGREQRQELMESLKTFGDSVVQRMMDVAALQKGQLETFSDQLGSFAKASGERLDAVRTESATGAKLLREEVVTTLKSISDTINKTMSESASAQQNQFESFSSQLGSFAKASGERLDGVRAESASGAKQLREEVVTLLKTLSETIKQTMGELGDIQKAQLEAFSSQLDSFAKASGERLDGVRAESATAAKQLREEVVATLKSISETMGETMKDQLEAFSGQVASLTKTSGDKLDGMRTESANGAKLLREEVIAALKGITEASAKTMGELSRVQKEQLQSS